MWHCAILFGSVDNDFDDNDDANYDEKLTHRVYVEGAAPVGQFVMALLIMIRMIMIMLMIIMIMMMTKLMGVC